MMSILLKSLSYWWGNYNRERIFRNQSKLCRAWRNTETPLQCLTPNFRPHYLTSAMKTRSENGKRVFSRNKVTRLYLVIMMRKQIYNRVHYCSALKRSRYIKHAFPESLLLYNVVLWTSLCVGRDKVCRIRAFYIIQEGMGRYEQMKKERMLTVFNFFCFFWGNFPYLNFNHNQNEVS